MMIFIVIIKDKNEIGFEIPRSGYNILMNNPKNIKKAILNPTEYKIVSIVLSLFNFSICRINNPGKTVRKRKPKICLKNGISKRIAMSVKRSIEIINTNHSLCPNFNPISVH